jgi:hypothetical protein
METNNKQNKGYKISFSQQQITVNVRHIYYVSFTMLPWMCEEIEAQIIYL